MNELIIQKHNFEKAKEEIKAFSEQTTTDLELKKVKDSKGVGEFLEDYFLCRGIGLKHTVSGEELNELTAQIQTHLLSINDTQLKLIKEFGQVYCALEALDKDYIHAILVSIDATKKTSQGIQNTQEQIKKIVENQKKTLEELQKFKQKLDSYTHLGDIDQIWSDYQSWIEEKKVLSKSIENIIERSKESEKKVELIAPEIQANRLDIAASKTNSSVEALVKRIKYAYLIAGGSVGLVIVELILHFMKVI